MPADTTCWATDVTDGLDYTSTEIVGMYLVGPEAREYEHIDVQRALGALGIDVPLEDVEAHRKGRCPCAAARRQQKANV